MRVVNYVESRMESVPEAHPITPDAQKYLDTMTKEQMELHVLATRMLGSSYFVERTRGYLAWKASSNGK